MSCNCNSNCVSTIELIIIAWGYDGFELSGSDIVVEEDCSIGAFDFGV